MEEAYENYGSKMDEALRKMSALESLALGKELSKSDAQTIREFKCVQDFLDSPNNSKQDNDLKKLFAQAIIAGMQSGTLPFKMPENASPESIVSVIDEGLTRLKVAYQLENGLLEDEYEAQKIVVEHQAVRAATLTEMLVEKGIELANQTIDNIENLGHFYADFFLDNVDTLFIGLEAACPPAAPVIEFCRVVVANVKPQIKEFIHNGISKVATVAKSYAKKAIEKTPEVLTKAIKILLE